MSIKSGLLLYNSKRYQSHAQICTKYRLIPRSLDYGRCNVKFRKGRRLRIPRLQHIAKISQAVNLSRFVCKGISQLTVQPCYLRKLRLILCRPQGPHMNSLTTRKILRKYISKAKRVSSIDIEIESEEHLEKSVLRYFAFLRSLKNVKIRFLSAQEVSFKALQKLLFSSRSRKAFPLLQNMYLLFELQPDHIMNQDHLNNYLRNFSQAVALYKKSPMMNLAELKIRTPIFVVPEEKIALEFAESLENFPNLIYLGTAFEPTIPFSLSLKITQILQNLRVLDFCLVGNHTDNLPQIVEKAIEMKFLMKFVIWMRRTKIEPVKVFFRELKKVQQIEWFILNCEGCYNIDNDALGTLAQSLPKLASLKTLEINLNMPNHPIQMTCAGVDKVFKSIEKMRTLEDLSLFFNGIGEGFTQKAYQTLCTSIKALPDLKSLTLFFEGNRYEEKDLTVFEKMLKRSAALETLCLNLIGLSWINSVNLSEFLLTLGSLNTLKILSLKLKCSELNRDLARTFVSMLEKLKNLDSFILNLLSEKDEDPQLPLQTYNQILKFDQRMYIGIERL